jgi:hypothetical protein
MLPRPLLTIAVALSVCFPSMNAFAIDSFKVYAQCHTEDTDMVGISARSKVCTDTKCYKAPAGYVISKDNVRVSDLGSKGGASSSCKDSYDDYAEVIPGLKQPTKVCIQTTAESEGSITCIGCTATGNCVAEGQIVKIP